MVGLIPRAGLRVFKKRRNEGTAFALQTVREPHGSNDNIKWQGLQWEIKYIDTQALFYYILLKTESLDNAVLEL